MGRQLRRVGEVMCQSSTHVNEQALNRLCIPKKPGAAIEAQAQGLFDPGFFGHAWAAMAAGAVRIAF